MFCAVTLFTACGGTLEGTWVLEEVDTCDGTVDANDTTDPPYTVSFDDGEMTVHDYDEGDVSPTEAEWQADIEDDTGDELTLQPKGSIDCSKDGDTSLGDYECGDDFSSAEPDTVDYERDGDQLDIEVTSGDAAEIFFLDRSLDHNGCERATLHFEEK
jgi:hypothetical protein